MTEWRRTVLGDVCELKRGYDLPTAVRETGAFPVVSSSGVTGYHSASKVQGPGVVTGRYGTLGEVFFIEEDYWPLNTALYVRDFKGNDPRFVAALLQSLKLGRNDGAAAVPGVNRNHLHGLPVLCPDTVTQRRVSLVLRALDELIDNNRRRIELLDQMAQTIYREWFLRLRYPGHADAALVDSPFGPVPDGWEATTIGEVAYVNVKSRTPAPDEAIRYLDISGLGDRQLKSPCQIRGEEAPGRARRVVRPGDIVWSMVRPGRRAHALLIAPGDDWIASTGLAVLTAARISNALLFETVSAAEFSAYLVSQEGGSAYPAVKPRDFEDAPFLRPAADLDRAFDAAVNPLHRLAWDLREISGRVVRLRDLLLPKLVTGDIDVSKLDLDAVVEAVA